MNQMGDVDENWSDSAVIPQDVKAMLLENQLLKKDCEGFRSEIKCLKKTVEEYKKNEVSWKEETSKRATENVSSRKSISKLEDEIKRLNEEIETNKVQSRAMEGEQVKKIASYENMVRKLSKGSEETESLLIQYKSNDEVLNNFKRDVADLKNQVNNLKNQNEAVLSDKAEKMAELTNFYEGKLRNLQEERKEEQRESSILMDSQLNAMRIEEAKLKRRIDQLMKELDEAVFLRKENETLKLKVTMYEEQIAELPAIEKEIEEHRRDSQKTLEKSSADFMKAVGEKEEEIRRLKGKLEETIRTNHDEMLTYNEEKDQVLESLKRKERDLKNLELKLEEVNKKYDNVVEELTTEKEKKGVVEKDENEINSLHKRIKELQAEHNSEINVLQKHIETTKNKNKDLKERLERAESNMQPGTSRKIDETDENIAELHKIVDTCEKAKINDAKKIQELSQVLIEKDTEVAHLRKALDEATKKQTSVSKESPRANKINDESSVDKEEIKKLQKTIEEIKKGHEAEIKGLTEESSSANEVLKLRQKIDDIKKDHEREISNLQENIDKMTAELGNKKTDISIKSSAENTEGQKGIKHVEKNQIASDSKKDLLKNKNEKSKSESNLASEISKQSFDPEIDRLLIVIKERDEEITKLRNELGEMTEKYNAMVKNIETSDDSPLNRSAEPEELNKLREIIKVMEAEHAKEVESLGRNLENMKESQQGQELEKLVGGSETKDNEIREYENEIKRLNDKVLEMELSNKEALENISSLKKKQIKDMERIAGEMKSQYEIELGNMIERVRVLEKVNKEVRQRTISEDLSSDSNLQIEYNKLKRQMDVMKENYDQLLDSEIKLRKEVEAKLNDFEVIGSIISPPEFDSQEDRPVDRGDGYVNLEEAIMKMARGGIKCLSFNEMVQVHENLRDSLADFLEKKPVELSLTPAVRPAEITLAPEERKQQLLRKIQEAEDKLKKDQIEKKNQIRDIAKQIQSTKKKTDALNNRTKLLKNATRIQH